VRAEEILRANSLWERIQEIVWAVEDERTPRAWSWHHVSASRPAILRDRDGLGTEGLYERAQLMRDLGRSERELDPVALDSERAELEFANAERQLAGCSPQEAINWALGRYGSDCAISFSGLRTSYS
jgi:hypothetical protein